MRYLTHLALSGAVVAVALFLIVAARSALGSTVGFGYYWEDHSLAYDTEFSYFFDVAVYPEGIFADCQPHYYAYVTAQNKHITYAGTAYSVELVLQYGYGVNNAASIKRVWVNDFDDPSRFTSPWIDSDADGVDYWELSTLEAGGYLAAEADATGDVHQFLRVQQQTVFVSESSTPVQSTWENRFFFYNFGTASWVLKMKDSFTIPASRSAVRTSTYSAGSGIWAGILEVEGAGGPPDYGKPPVKKVVYQNRSVKVVDGGVTTTVDLDNSNNIWVQPQAPYQLYHRSQPVFTEYVAGNEDLTQLCSTPTASATSTNTPTPTNTSTRTPTPTASATITPTATATIDPTLDTDGDGCSDYMELALSPPTNPADPWDFYSVPAPALFAAPDPLSAVRDNIVGAADAQAVFGYFKKAAKTGSLEYEQDLNANGIKDGLEYDRSFAGPGMSGPPDGIVSAADAQLAFAQFKHNYKC